MISSGLWSSRYPGPTSSCRYGTNLGCARTLLKGSQWGFCQPRKPARSLRPVLPSPESGVLAAVSLSWPLRSWMRCACASMASWKARRSSFEKTSLTTTKPLVSNRNLCTSETACSASPGSGPSARASWHIPANASEASQRRSASKREKRRSVASTTWRAERRASAAATVRNMARARPGAFHDATERALRRKGSRRRESRGVALAPPPVHGYHKTSALSGCHFGSSCSPDSW